MLRSHPVFAEDRSGHGFPGGRRVSPGCPCRLARRGRGRRGRRSPQHALTLFWGSMLE